MHKYNWKPNLHETSTITKALPNYKNTRIPILEQILLHNTITKSHAQEQMHKKTIAITQYHKNTITITQ